MQFENKIVGIVIRDKRTQKGMTQELLSGLAGIARTHLTMIENGSKQPNFETRGASPSHWNCGPASWLPPSKNRQATNENTARVDSQSAGGQCPDPDGNCRSFRDLPDHVRPL